MYRLKSKLSTVKNTDVKICQPSGVRLKVLLWLRFDRYSIALAIMRRNQGMTENEFHEHLCAYPELRTRFEQLLTIVENANGEVALADEAERRAIE